MSGSGICNKCGEDYSWKYLHHVELVQSGWDIICWPCHLGWPSLDGIDKYLEIWYPIYYEEKEE